MSKALKTGEEKDMEYKIDHDYHLHTKLSLCSLDNEMTPQRIMRYAEENGFSSVCITDHFWDASIPTDSPFYTVQNFEHISESLPLPESDRVKMYFGCECEMAMDTTLSITDETIEKLDFVIVPTTHLHMTNFTIPEEKCNTKGRIETYVSRFEALLSKKLPFHKIGIAHLTDSLIAPESFQAHIDVIEGIPDSVFYDLFSASAEKGMGIELNMETSLYSESDFDKIMRPYKIAKDCGCLFYLGSDAHHPESLEGIKENFSKMTRALKLGEKDKFHFTK